jgi:hypothetical protein
VAAAPDLTVDRDEAVKRIKLMAIRWRDEHIPHISRRRMSDGSKEMLRKDWTKDLDSLILALRVMGDHEL